MYLTWIISISLILVYILRIFTFFLGWRRIEKKVPHKSEKSGTTPDVSVVIPLRNEEENIIDLLKDLFSQESLPGKYEVILVDDHSVDNTLSLLQGFCSEPENALNRSAQDEHHQFPEIRILSLDAEEQGKKAALHKGISAASHPLILNCDGDCRVSHEWVEQMTGGFSDPDVKMMIGPVVFEPDRIFFQAMQSLEFFSLTAVSAGSSGLNNPVLCNAANLAYYKADYLNFSSQEIRVSESGDDIFLMLWMKKQFPGSIRYSAPRGSLVRTPPARTLPDFIAQRMRWTSKSRNYRDPNMIFTAMLTYGMNAMLLGILIAGFFRNELLILFLLLLILKSGIDLLLLAPVLWRFGKIRLLRYFFPMEIVYFMYVSLVGLLGQFFSFTWKGRRIPVKNRENKSIESGN